MNREYPSLESAKGAMIAISQGAATGALDVFGINEDDLQYVMGDVPWNRDKIHRCQAVLDALTYGALTVAGLPKIVVPAEWRAAVIATFVRPCNFFVAAAISERANTASELGVVEDIKDRPVTAKRLLALVLQIYSNQDSVRQQWEKAVGRAVKESKRLTMESDNAA